MIKSEDKISERANPPRNSPREFPLVRSLGMVLLLILSAFGGMIFCHSGAFRSVLSPFRSPIQSIHAETATLKAPEIHDLTKAEQVSTGSLTSELHSNQVIIYGTTDGQHLKPYIIGLPWDIAPSMRLRISIEELISAASKEPDRFALPSGVQLRGVYKEYDTAVIDLTGSITYPLGGPMAELLCIFGLVNTAAKNAPEIKHVRILLNGNKSDVLWGNIDISEPLSPDYSLAQD